MEKMTSWKWSPCPHDMDLAQALFYSMLHISHYPGCPSVEVLEVKDVNLQERYHFSGFLDDMSKEIDTLRVSFRGSIGQVLIVKEKKDE